MRADLYGEGSTWPERFLVLVGKVMTNGAEGNRDNTLVPRPRWSLWRAALYGLIASIIVLAINTLADGGEELSDWSNPSRAAGYLVGSLGIWPIIFVIVVAIRNLVVRN
jgi:hypothetical protein